MNPYQSPTAIEAIGSRKAARRLPVWAGLGVLLLIWTVSWCVSMLSFHAEWGCFPAGDKSPFDMVGELVIYPVTFSPIALPASTAKIILDCFAWLPGGLVGPLAVLAGLAYWPVYITFVFLAFRTGKLRYFAVPAVMNLFASFHWHRLCEYWLGI